MNSEAPISTDQLRRLRSTLNMVLLPGMIGTADLFEPLLGLIPPEISVQVIAYPPDRFLPYSELLGHIETELAGQRELILVGESYSGALALAFAAAHSQQVRAVILSAAFVLPPWPSWVRWLIRPWMLRISIPSFLIRILVAGPDAPDKLIIRIRDSLQVPKPHVMVARAEEVLTMDYRSSLAGCAAPILYLAPDSDHMVGPESLAEILRVRPDVQVSPLCGPHLILQTAPKLAWSMIEAWLLH